MPVPGPGGEKARQIQNVGTYIEGKIPGAQGTALASDYEAYAAAHSALSAGSAFLGWMFVKLGPHVGDSLGLALGDSGKAANQIAAGTVSGLDKTGQNKIDKALGTLEQLGIDAGKAAGSALTSLNPLAGLFQANIWMRVAEVVLGLVLIAIGVAKLTHAVPAAAKIAEVAA